RPIELLWGRALLVGLVGALGGLGPALTISALLHALRARPDGRCTAVGAVAGALLAAGLVAAAPPRLTLARLLEGAPIGAALGGVLGLLVGIALAARRAPPEEPVARSNAPTSELGLSAHELALATACALAATPLVLLLAMALTGGPRALVDLVQEAL